MDDKNTPDTEEDDFPGLSEIYSHSIDIDDLHVDCIFPPPRINASMATVDKRGVEHRGKGSSKGGQFVQKGMGESDKDLPSDEGRSQDQINKNFNDKPSDDLPRTRKDVVDEENLPATNKDNLNAPNKLGTSSKLDVTNYSSANISQEDLDTISALNQFYPTEYHDLLRSLAFEEVASVTPLKEEGINSSELLTLADGKKGVFKDSKGESGLQLYTPRLRLGVKPGSYYKREIATSAIAHTLGFGDLVPVTTVRKTKDSIGSIQSFIEDKDSFALNYYDTFNKDTKKLARAALFDYIIGNSDRHSGNWMVPSSDMQTTEYDDKIFKSKDPQSKESDVTLIDHGLCFPYRYVPHDFHNMKILDLASKQKLKVPSTSHMKKFWPKVEQILRTSGLEEEAINLTKQRFDTVTSGKYKTIGSLPIFASPKEGVNSVEDFRVYMDEYKKRIEEERDKAGIDLKQPQLNNPKNNQDLDAWNKALENLEKVKKQKDEEKPIENSPPNWANFINKVND